ncbi:MAG: hypothetical protein FJ014_06870 [Chloroflexi bacterium]|nr:hypothetical protein [Chloroflexota bacterium]
MTISTTYAALKTIALGEFGDVVASAQVMSLPTVVESSINDDPEKAVREFLTFVRRKLLSMP